MIDLFGKSPVPLPVLITGKLALLCSWLFPLAKLYNIGTMLYDSALTSWFGIVLFVGGTVMAIAAIAHLGESIAVGFPERETVLKTHGLYRFTRNPIYLGAFIMCAGSCCIAIHPVNLLFFLLAVVIHVTIVLREEKFLAGKFGREWDDYRSRVPRFIGFARRRG